jgi:excisionase family DNA binding protein
MSRQLIDAHEAGELLKVPHTWVLRKARQDMIPHVRLGHYVRFDADELEAWQLARRRGPRYDCADNENGPGAADTARGPTPKG